MSLQQVPKNSADEAEDSDDDLAQRMVIQQTVRVSDLACLCIFTPNGKPADKTGRDCILQASVRFSISLQLLRAALYRPSHHRLHSLSMQDCDWEKHPAEFILAHTLDQKASFLLGI